MKRLVHIFWLALILVAGATLMQISNQVDMKERELRRLTSQLMAHEDSIRVLKAEWAYLNQPQRLEKLSSKFLALKPVQVAQLQADLPAVQFVAAKPALPAAGLIKVAATTGHAR